LTRGRSDPPGLLRGATVAGALGLMVSLALPILIGAVMDGLGLSPAEAGLLSSLELGSMAAAQLGLAPRMHALSRRRLALGSAVLLVLASTGSAFVQTLPPLVALRVLAGVGAGGLLAASQAAIAGAAEPDRLYARAFLLGGGCSGLLLPLLPLVTAPWHQRGGYLALAGVTLLLLPLLSGLPAAAPAAQGQRTPRAPLALGAGLMMLGAAILLAASQGAVWAFSERIGLGTGLASGEIGIVLGAANMAGLAGAAAAAWLGLSRGRTLPMALGLAVVAGACWIIPRVAQPGAFSAAQLAFAAAYYFSIPFLLGLAAALDATGRLATAFGACTTIGTALGPVVGGWLVAGGGSYRPLGGAALVGALLALLLLAPVARRLDSRALR